MGEVIVRLTVNKKNGTYKGEIIGHEGGSTCGDGIDEDILEDLLNADIPEFGHLVDPQDGGKTCEYFEEKKAKQRPHSYMDDGSDGGDEEDTSENKKVGLGFGV